MKITNIECHVLLDPGCDIGATSSAQDDIVVEIHTDEGITGIGESDVNPWMAAACIEAPGSHTMGLGLKEMLLANSPPRPLEQRRSSGGKWLSEQLTRPSVIVRPRVYVELVSEHGLWVQWLA